MLKQTILWAALAPAALTAGVMLLANALRGSGRRLSWTPALAVGLAYAAGNLGLAGAPLGQGPETRLLYIALGATVVGLAEALLPLPTALRWVVRVGASTLAAWLLLAPLVSPMESSAAQTGLRLVLLSSATVAAWSVLDRLASMERGPSLALALTLLGGAGAGVMVLSGLASTGQLAGTLVASLAVLVLMTWRDNEVGRLRSAVPVVALLLVSHWSVALLYAEMPTVSYALLVVAPLTLLLAALPRLRARRQLVQLVARLLLVALPVAGAVASSAAHYLGSAAPPTTGDSAHKAAGAADDDYDY